MKFTENNKEYEMHNGVRITIADDYHLKVLFEDGITKLYDIRKAIKKWPELKPLENPELFRKVNSNCWGLIVWNDELDLNLSTVYFDGETVPNDELAEIYLLGYQVRMLRWEKNLTQAELAKKAGIKQSMLSKFELGKFNPSMKSIKRMADALEAKLTIKLDPKTPIK